MRNKKGENKKKNDTPFTDKNSILFVLKRERKKGKGGERRLTHLSPKSTQYYTRACMGEKKWGKEKRGEFKKRVTHLSLKSTQYYTRQGRWV